MDALVAVPQWFHGGDIVFEIVTCLIAFGLVYAGYKAWRLTGERKHGYFAAAFGLISLSFLARLFATATINLEAFSRTLVIPLTQAVGTGWRIFSIGRVGYVWLVLAAYALLLALALKWQRKRDYIILLSLVTIIAAASISVSWPFLVASLVLLFAIALQHYLNYQDKHSKLAFGTFIAFAFWSLEPLLYLLGDFDPSLVVAGYVVRMLAYLMLLRTVWRVL
jgi:hypothetical protein